MTTQENLLARHKILHELGRGPVGAVYAARDRTTGALVALKRLDPGLLKSDAGLAGRFLKQARSARRLRHRNIVAIHDAAEAAGTAYVAMEMLEGENLRTLLDRGPLPVARAIRIAHEIACGLAHAHLEGVVHGGLKPSNIIVSGSGAVKITDFGSEQAAPLSGAQAGCLGYLSPEQVRGDPVDHRCDIFSLGAVFYEMLTRRRPFAGDSPKEFVAPPPPSELNPLVPRALDAIVSSMLAVQPAARMPGLPVLLPELQRLEEGLGVGPGASAGTAEPAASVPPAEPAARTALAEPAASVPPVEPAVTVPRAEPAVTVPRAEPAARAAPAEPEPTLRTPVTAAADEVEQIVDRKMHEYIAMMERESRLQRAPRSRPANVAALALVLVALGIGLAGFMGVTPRAVAGFMDHWSGRIERIIAASRMQDTPAAAPVASRPAAPPPTVEAPKEPQTAPAAEAPKEPLTAPVAEAPKEPLTAPVAEAPKEPVTAPPAPPTAPVEADGKAQQEPTGTVSAPKPMPAKPLAVEPDPLPLTGSLFDRAPEQAESTRAAPAKQLPQTMRSTAKVPARKPGGTAMLILAVSPRGELYIDGQHHGMTPPITTLDLEPGLHRIEVRSGSRKPYVTYMTVEPGDVRRIRHDFDAKWSRPPG